jgi:hypothetical protein
MGCSNQQICCWVFWFVSIVLLVLGYVFDGMSKPNGELLQWYGIETCFNNAASFEVSGRGIFDAYLMRPTDGWEPGSACPTNAYTSRARRSLTTPAEVPPIEIALEKDDGPEEGMGFRTGASYFPIIALPAGAYATLAFEVRDASGRTGLPTCY